MLKKMKTTEVVKYSTEDVKSRVVALEKYLKYSAGDRYTVKC